MNISDKGRELIASFEGLSLTAYLCPAGVWTIGYGHTQNVGPGDRITKAHADRLLAADLVAYGQSVEKMLEGCPTSQHEFDAMGSLAFNVGLGGFGTSTVLRLHKKGDRIGASRAFTLWNKATVGGKLVELPGLTRRRAAEAAYYLTPDAPGVKDMPQEVEPPKSAASSKTVIAGGASVAAGAASVAGQIDEVIPVVESITAVGTTFKSVLQLGALALSIVALAAVGFMLWRYLQKRQAGDVVST